MSSKPSGADAEHWQAYWRAAVAGTAAVSGDAPGDLFDAQWRDFFARTLPPKQGFSLLDLACGAGIVLDQAIEAATHLGSTSSLLCGVDYATAAVAGICNKHAPSEISVVGMAASAHKLPFLEGSIDLVVSQFGLEYAGLEAFGEAARILAPGGSAQLITHYKGGGIDRECSANAITLAAILDSGVFELAIAMMRGFAPASTTEKLPKALAGLKAQLTGEPLSAKQFLSRLLPGIETLLARRHAYSLTDALHWLEAMRAEVRLYADRMNAMSNCALDADGVKDGVERLSSYGAAITDPEPLIPEGKSAPAAWLLRADQPARN